MKSNVIRRIYVLLCFLIMYFYFVCWERYFVLVVLLVVKFWIHKKCEKPKIAKNQYFCLKFGPVTGLNMTISKNIVTTPIIASMAQ